MTCSPSCSASRRRAPWSRSGRAAERAFAALAARHGVPVSELGVAGGDSLVVQGSFDIQVDELAAAHRGTLPGALRLAGSERARPVFAGN